MGRLLKNDIKNFVIFLILLVFCCCQHDSTIKKVSDLNTIIFKHKFNCSDPSKDRRVIEGIVSIGPGLISRICEMQSKRIKILSQVNYGDIYKDFDKEDSYEYFHSLNYLADSSDGVCVRYKYEPETKSLHIVGYATLKGKRIE